jgi:hypothetical protein
MLELRRKDPASGDGKKIERALESLDSMLLERGVECLNLEGQRYDDGRLDFEPIGAEEEAGSADHECIGRCEKPVIKVDGKLLQKARGVVIRPARTAR